MPEHSHLTIVKTLLAHGVAFETIESWIDSRDDIDEETKAGLWLYALTAQKREHQRQIIGAAIPLAERRSA